MFRCAAALVLVAACGVRAAAPIDVAALERAEGEPAARRELVARIAAHPRDISSRLALAALDDRLGRPGDAIAELEAVEAIAGPLGVRWHDADRARLARLVHARGQARLRRGAPSAWTDLRRAAELGAAVTPDELHGAELASAWAQLRHSDNETRAAARGRLAALGVEGAAADASPERRLAFGRACWAAGARRAAVDVLTAWHDAVRDPSADASGQALYLRAIAWWRPSQLGDVPEPPANELVGAERCRFQGARCRASEAHGDAAAAVALASAPIDPGARVSDPDDVLAWLAIAEDEAAAGRAAWGATVRARIDVRAALERPELPEDARSALAALAGEPLVQRAGPTAHAADVREGARWRGVATLLRGGDPAAEPRPPWLHRVPPSTLLGDVRATAVASYARARVPDGPEVGVLARIAHAYRRDPAVAERLARDAIASAPDAAAASAAAGALFDALEDPARARAAWQRAADASREPAYLAGLAVAMAHGSDPDAALIAATAAAAASGDPATVWVRVAHALADADALPHALTAARSAIDLAGPDALADALDVAIAASRALGRDAQADQLVARRARISPALSTQIDGAGALTGATDPTDDDSALAELAERPSAAALARLWVATRWNPRDATARAVLLHALPAEDPRAPTLLYELAAIAADPDTDATVALTAAQALR